MDIKAPAPNKVAPFFMKSLRLFLKSSLMAFSWIKKQKQKGVTSAKGITPANGRHCPFQADRRWSAQI
ncbi:MAG: hypothetical protein K8H75_15010 [Sulfuricella sp.]|nr:hypothetical protein [Sulfuricella sp.]